MGEITMVNHTADKFFALLRHYMINLECILFSRLHFYTIPDTLVAFKINQIPTMLNNSFKGTYLSLIYSS